MEEPVSVTAGIEVFPAGDFAASAAREIARRLPARGNVVITGGGTAAAVYPELARALPDWSGLDVFFSDERCVLPDDAASNYRMAKETLLDAVRPRTVHRMEGERDPEEAAGLYDEIVAAAGDLDLIVLGLGADAHVAGLFPGSPGLVEAALCVPVDRPDGMRGISLTPPALLSGDRIAIVVTGHSKAEAVARTIEGDEDVLRCPAAMFDVHPSVTFLLDDEAAAGL
jgi:6-phosphogluconolactonase